MANCKNFEKIENFMAKFDELKDLPVNIVSLQNREHVQMDIVQYLELDLQLYLAPIVFIVIIIFLSFSWPNLHCVFVCIDCFQRLDFIRNIFLFFSNFYVKEKKLKKRKEKNDKIKRKEKLSKKTNKENLNEQKKKTKTKNRIHKFYLHK